MGLSGADDDVLGPEGMEKFCEDIGVEPENVSWLSNINVLYKCVIWVNLGTLKELVMLSGALLPSCLSLHLYYFLILTKNFPRRD